MIRINLLPHREEARKRRQQQFMVLAGISLVFALLVGGFVAAMYYVRGRARAAQQELSQYAERPLPTFACRARSR